MPIGTVFAETVTYIHTPIITCSEQLNSSAQSYLFVHVHIYVGTSVNSISVAMLLLLCVSDIAC